MYRHTRKSAGGALASAVYLAGSLSSAMAEGAPPDFAPARLMGSKASQHARVSARRKFPAGRWCKDDGHVTSTSHAQTPETRPTFVLQTISGGYAKLC